jgi:hypothetical protein
MKLAHIQRGLIVLTTVAAFTFVSHRSTAPARAQAASNSLSTIEGRVILVGKRVAGASVTLYAAGEGTPTEVTRSQTDAEGAMTFRPTCLRQRRIRNCAGSHVFSCPVSLTANTISRYCRCLRTVCSWRKVLGSSRPVRQVDPGSRN